MRRVMTGQSKYLKVYGKLKPLRFGFFGDMICIGGGGEGGGLFVIFVRSWWCRWYEGGGGADDDVRCTLLGVVSGGVWWECPLNLGANGAIEGGEAAIQ